MTKQLHSEVTLKGSNVVGTIVGKGFLEKDGKVEERYIIKIDSGKVTLPEIAPFIEEIIINPDQIIR